MGINKPKRIESLCKAMCSIRNSGRAQRGIRGLMVTVVSIDCYVQKKKVGCRKVKRVQTFVTS